MTKSKITKTEADMKVLRAAGGSGWDKIDDPESYIEELTMTTHDADRFLDEQSQLRPTALIAWLRQQAVLAEAAAVNRSSEREAGFDSGMAAAFRITLARVGGL